MLKNKVNKFINYIEKIEEWKWIILSLLICILFLISISPQIMWQPFIFAEDGGIFLKDALFEGKASLNNTYGGYLSVIPRSIAILATYIGRHYNSIIAVTFVMKNLAILIIALCVNYFNTKQFEWFIKNRITRLFVSLICISVMANSHYMLYNVTYTHWWCGLLSFFVSLNLINKKIPPFYIMPLLLLAIVTSPSALIIEIALIYYLCVEIIEIIKKKNMKKYIEDNKINILKSILIIIVGFIQVYAILFIPLDIQTKETFNLQFSIPIIIENVSVGLFKNIEYTLTFGMSEKLLIGVNLFIGFFIWSVLFFASLKNKTEKIYLFSMLSIFILYFLAEYKNIYVWTLPASKGDWYNSVPATIGVILCIKTLYECYFKCLKFLKFLIVSVAILYFVLFYTHICKPYYAYCKRIYKIEPRVNFNSEKNIDIKIGSDSWTLTVPIE